MSLPLSVTPARRRGLLATAAVLCALALPLLPAREGTAAAPTVKVAITKFAFAPREITVAPGSTIVWTNQDETPHTVTSNDKSFASKGLDTDDTYEHTFGTEGDFTYLCTVHPFMTGVVHVRKP